MDLIVSIIVLFGLTSFKMINSKNSNIVEASVTTNDGSIENVSIKEDTLTVGNNLLLRKENRAYHKILDELGLK